MSDKQMDEATKARWDDWIEHLFEECIDGIRLLDPEKNNDHWQLLWDIMDLYKRFRENKAEHECKEEDE